MTSDDVLLKCSDVNKSYGGVRAVKNVSLSLGAGEILGLVGPNGAGKTTTVDIIAGVQRADSGTVTVRGLPLTGPPSRRSRRGGLARTFQHPQLALDLTIRENMLVGAAAERLASPLTLARELLGGIIRPETAALDREIEVIADELSLEGLDRLCADLTLGEQRLVEVGRALLRKPSLVLLDEPFAGSDARGVAGITTVLAAITGRGCGVLLVDHNVDIVASLVDRIVLMDRGTVAFEGDPEECLRSPEMQLVYFGERSQT